MNLRTKRKRNNEAVKRWQKRNPDKVIASRKAWRDRNLTYHTDRRKKVRMAVFEKYGNKCACCGESLYEFLVIDHINNDGKGHRAMFNNHGDSIYKDILESPIDHAKYQVLCHNCNMAKACFGECPHKGRPA